MAAGSSAGSGHNDPQQAHPAFPAMGPPPINADQVPNNPRALRALIESTTDSRFVIPMLAAVAAGTNQQGNKKVAQMRNGEMVLQMWGWDLYGIEDSDIAANTAALMYIVSARMQSDSKTRRDKNLFALAARLCVVGEPAQIAACIERIGGLAWGICECATHDDALMPEALQVLKTLIDRTAPAEVFNAAYPAFLQLCLSSGRTMDGLPVALNPFTEVVRGTRYQDILAFYHHAGTTTAVAGQHKRATELFNFAVSMPSQSVSAIQIACAKRAILCGLLSTGKVISYAKYIPSSVSRQIERSAAEYNKLAKAYENRDWATVYKALENPVFGHDCNAGLVMRVVESIPRRQIVHLREVFSKISIAQLARRLELLGPQKYQDCQDIVVDMTDRPISQGEIRAQVTLGQNADTTIVAFADPEEPIDPSTTFVELERNRSAIIRLEQAMAVANREMGVNEAYIKKQADMLYSGTRRGKGTMDLDRGMENYDPDAAVSSFWSRPNRVGADQGDMGY